MNKEVLKQGFAYWFFDGDVKFEDLEEHDKYFVNRYAEWIMKEARKMALFVGFIGLIIGAIIGFFVGVGL